MNKYSLLGVFGEKNKEKTDFALFNKFNEKADVFYIQIQLKSIHLKLLFFAIDGRWGNVKCIWKDVFCPWNKWEDYFYTQSIKH